MLALLEELLDVRVCQVVELRADVDADYVAVLGLAQHELDLRALRLPLLHLESCHCIFSELNAVEQGLVCDRTAPAHMNEPVHQSEAEILALKLHQTSIDDLAVIEVGS